MFEPNCSWSAVQGTPTPPLASSTRCSRCADQVYTSSAIALCESLAAASASAGAYHPHAGGRDNAGQKHRECCLGKYGARLAGFVVGVVPLATAP